MHYAAVIFEKPITDQCVYAKLNLPQGELLQEVKVIRRDKDDVKCSHYPNLFLNALTCDVEFSDGQIKEHSANVIA